MVSTVDYRVLNRMTVNTRTLAGQNQLHIFGENGIGFDILDAITVLQNITTRAEKTRDAVERNFASLDPGDGVLECPSKFMVNSAHLHL